MLPGRDSDLDLDGCRERCRVPRATGAQPARQQNLGGPVLETDGLLTDTDDIVRFRIAAAGA